MPSDSIAGFLDKAQANRVLVPEQVEQLIRQPDVPQTDLNALCEYLQQRGALTRFQADMLRQGRGEELNFAGYPVLEEAGPCPGGVAYRARHPSLRTPVVLRRFRLDTLQPDDTPAALADRARAAAAVHHPNLLPPLDAGTYRDEPYAAVEVPAGDADLESLVKEIGPMPAFLAAEYGREVASALRAAHERGLWHGDVRPANLFVGPLTAKEAPDGTVKKRPAPNAAVRLAELGLVPVRPGAAHDPAARPEALAYLPPERVDAGRYDSRGDLYGLGASLYYLLTGRPPFTGASAEEVLSRVRATPPAPLAALRPDLPPEFAALVHDLMAKRPEDRPPTAWDAEAALAKFCRPGTIPPPAAGAPVVHLAHPLTDHPPPDAEPVAEAVPAEEWGADTAFTTSHADTAPRPRKPATQADKHKTRLMVILGLCLHLTAVGLLVAYLMGAFERSPKEEPEPTPKKEKGKDKTRNPRT